MTIEEQVVSLELAKQLKETGYPQKESLFYWNEYSGHPDTPKKLVYKIQTEWETRGLTITKGMHFAAPTATELGDQLPSMVFSRQHGDGALVIVKYTKDDIHHGWSVFYDDIRTHYPTIQLTKVGSLPFRTLANEMAKMWLYIKREGLL